MTVDLPTHDRFQWLFEISDSTVVFEPRSTKAMCDLRAIDPARFETLMGHIKSLKFNTPRGAERLLKAIDAQAREMRRQERRGSVPNSEPGEDGFVRGDKGRILSNAPNVRNAIERLGYVLRYDSFAGRVLLIDPAGQSKFLSDDEMKDLWVQIDDKFQFQPTTEVYRNTIGQTARLDKFHPVLDHIRETSWDWVPRIDTWLIDYFHIEDTPFHRAIGRIFLIAACRRLLEPGCKFDEALLIGGPQGVGKSTAIKLLAMRPDWFTDSLPFQDSEQKIIEQTQGKWIIEIAEMRGARKVDQESMKAHMSRTSDRARPAYGWTVQEVPRQFVTCMSTNNPKSLSDPTGNRRFWPIWVDQPVDLAGLADVREQLWAEALEWAETKESITLPKHLWEDARSAQAEHTRDNPFEDTLRFHIPDELEGIISSEELWAILGIPAGQRNMHAETFGAAMASMGFTRVRRKYKGRGKAPCYARPAVGSVPELHVERGSDGRVVRVGPAVVFEDHRDEDDEAA
ncbi:virulence-associated E family protein [Devosia ginsengisoli]|uniref:virulence-associated E family protein n=1 Tax=Devosia ginsengisoli TaxID=400770 RepID=UPI0026EB5E4D|nr:virulence-associated E family protein [Devosia ginsengisoli]MCR6671284.1 virulence-associated E family protein [Devosia ginsengisoli]